MFQGRLVGIYIAPAKAVELQRVDEVRAIPGRGLQGDRYEENAGTFSKSSSPRDDQEVSLIEIEAVEAVNRDYGLALTPSQTRRNLITQHVPLNQLVGSEFMVGEVRLRGVRLCEPCSHLEKLTATGIREALIHRGGLRAQVITEGTLRSGDPIRFCDG